MEDSPGCVTAEEKLAFQNGSYIPIEITHCLKREKGRNKPHLDSTTIGDIKKDCKKKKKGKKWDTGIFLRINVAINSIKSSRRVCASLIYPKSFFSLTIDETEDPIVFSP